ncbi:MAG: hypothetical protein IIC90_10900 [Chloroflexi bacterium]|nr:hypothetical protein [Chloroflexota bacterium]
MRFLSPTLLAAQKEASAEPFVEVKVSDRAADIVRLRWSRLYTGGETDAYHAAAMPADGSLLRARIDPAGPTFHYQRTANPDDLSDYSSWTQVGSTIANRGVALTTNGANVLRAHVASAGSNIRVDESSDNGATFGSAVTAASLAGVTWLACSLKSNGDAFLIYANATTVYAVKRLSGVWGTPAAWPFSANSITGVTVAWAGDFNLVIAGTDTNDNPRLWAAIYGDGGVVSAGTWLLLSPVAEADAGSNVSVKAPSFTYLNNGWLFFVEQYTGAVAYDRPHWTWFPPSQSFQANGWREPVPFDLASSYGMAITGSLSHAWLSTPAGVWRAAHTWQATDLSGDVQELTLETQPEGGRAKITLRNDDGRYNDLANGAYSVLRPGAQVAIGAGYITSAGQELPAPGLNFWLDGWEYTSAGGEATLVLYASNLWALIAGWRARRQYTWQAGDKTVAQILTFLFGRAGVELVTAGTSATATSHKPAFTIHPGEDGLRAARRLLAMIPDVIQPVDSFVYLTEPKATDSSDYSYGADHVISHARYASAGLAANRVQVFGDGLVAQDFDWPDVADQFDRLRQVFDLNMTTQAKAETRVVTTLRREDLSVPLGELVTPVNCGQDIYDVVTVTDPNAGLTAVDYRVAGVKLRYARRGRTPVYEQRLLLSKV